MKLLLKQFFYVNANKNCHNGLLILCLDFDPVMILLVLDEQITREQEALGTQRDVRSKTSGLYQ